MVSDEAVAQSSISQYNQMIAELRQNNLLANNTADGQRINQIGRRISRAVEQYLTANGMQDKIKSLQWEFNLIKSKDINAFALPGGKIAFYTGILPVLKTDAAIAFVMGHEIGHAVTGVPVISDDLAQQGLSLGLLKFNRTQEYEADKYGMIFMAMAGYNPQEAIAAQQRMMDLGGSQQAEILSSHPSTQNRIEELKRFLPEAMKYYKK